MPKPVISVEHLTKKYDLGVIGTGTLTRDVERWWARTRHKPDPYSIIGQRDTFSQIGESILALDDVSFSVEQGETLGIIGRNGAGKSTLLKILSRVTAPTSGVVKVKGRIGSLLEVGTGFHPELTGRENVFLNGAILGMKKAEVARKFDEIVAFSGVEKFIDTPVKRYSSGMYVRLAFAVAAHLDPEILIVDEVLAVGDAEFQKKCLGKMGEVAGEGRTVLFVSHNMNSINELCEKSILIDSGKIGEINESRVIIEKYMQGKIRHMKREIDKNPIDRNFAGPYEILSIWIENDQGIENYSFNHFDSIIFCLRIRSYKNPVVIGVSIIDIFNQNVLYLSNINDKEIIAPDTDESIVKVKLDQLLLRGGEYAVTFSLNTSNNIHCDLWRDAVTVRINDFNRGKYQPTSPIIFQAKWKLNNIQSAD